MKKRAKTTKSAVRKSAKKSTKKVVRKPAKSVARKATKKVPKRALRKKKMTIKEYAEHRNIDLTRHFIGKNPNMSMQTYLKRGGFPDGARLFRVLYNEKA